jgi:SAM-dependent methyltransferase
VTAADSGAVLLDREQAERVSPLGRALDVGCGPGRYTPELAGASAALLSRRDAPPAGQ